MNTIKHKDFPCKNCSHSGKLHNAEVKTPSKTVYSIKVCIGSIVDDSYALCGCIEFIPDNLKYLEDKFVKKEKD